MHLVSIITLGIAANLDNLGIALSYGIRKIKVVLVGIWVLVSAYWPAKKTTESSHLNQDLSMQNIMTIIKEPMKADIDYSGKISLQEAILLGVALAVNCVATGFGAGLTGVSVAGVTLSVIFFSLLTIFIGVYTGAR